MTPIAELFSREDQNVDKIYLYPEGLFYKAYLRSAFLFIRDYGNFKPIKKKIKQLQRELVSIGFPRSAIDKYFPEDILTSYNDGALSAPCKPIDEAAYDEWFDALPLFEKGEFSASSSIVKSSSSSRTAASEAKKASANASATTCPAPPSASKSAADPCDEVIRRLRDFRLDASTPIECMLLVAALQKELDTLPA